MNSPKRTTLCLILASFLGACAAHASVVFSTNFTGETTDSTVLPNGAFSVAVANPGTWYRSGNATAFDAAFYAQSRTGNWGPPADTVDVALRVGFGTGADFQARLALSTTWDSAQDYTLTVTHQTWGQTWRTSGNPVGEDTSQLNMSLGYWNGSSYVNLGSVNQNNTITDAGWTQTSFTVDGATILGAGAVGENILIRLQNNIASSTASSTTYVDSLTLTAVPEPSTFALLGGLGALVLVVCRRLRK